MEDVSTLLKKDDVDDFDFVIHLNAPNYLSVGK